MTKWEIDCEQALRQVFEYVDLHESQIESGGSGDAPNCAPAVFPASDATVSDTNVVDSEGLVRTLSYR